MLHPAGVPCEADDSEEVVDTSVGHETHLANRPGRADDLQVDQCVDLRQGRAVSLVWGLVAGLLPPTAGCA